MTSDFERRFKETVDRSYEANSELYDQRTSEDKDTGILKIVMAEQACERRRDEYGQ
ncbi:MAG: hypothetical protein WC867_03530 [Candidatus Pacearchaeota archaeon]|jgi:hypothetical protein